MWTTHSFFLTYFKEYMLQNTTKLFSTMSFYVLVPCYLTITFVKT